MSLKRSSQLDVGRAKDLVKVTDKMIGKRKAPPTDTADSKDIDDLFEDLKKAKKVAAEEKAAQEEARTEQKRKEKAARLAAKKAEAEAQTSAPPGSYIDSTNKTKRAHGVCQPGESSYIISPDPSVHRWDDASGLPVYKAHLLKVGEGGGTPLCPFDCDCCF